MSAYKACAQLSEVVIPSLGFSHGLTGSIYGFCTTHYIIDVLVVSVRTSVQTNIGKSGMNWLMDYDRGFTMKPKLDKDVAGLLKHQKPKTTGFWYIYLLSLLISVCKRK